MRTSVLFRYVRLGVSTAPGGFSFSGQSMVELTPQGTALFTVTPTNAINPGAVSILSQDIANALQMNVDGVTVEAGSVPVDFETNTSFSATFQYTDDNGTYQKTITITIQDAPAIQITTAGYLDTARMLVGEVLQDAYVPGVYPNYNGNAVSETAVDYTVDGSPAIGTYVLQSGDLVAQPEITISAATADDLTYFGAITNITDFTFTPTDLEWVVPAGAGAPTLSSPVDAANGGTAATGSVTTDGTDGTLYWVVTQSLTSPTKAQVKAGQDHTGAAAADAGSQVVSGSGVQNLSPAPSGLTSETFYVTHYMHENASALQSNVASGDGFTTADITAPTLSSPVDAANGASASTGSVDTNEANGTLYWVVTTSTTSPSAAQVKAGQDHLGAAAAASGSQSVSSTGTQNLSPAPSSLAATTTYYTHFMHEDAAGNQSTVSSADGFTTTASGSAASVVQIVKAYQNTANDANISGTTPIVVGSDTNRAVLAVVCYAASANSTNTSGSTATLGGNAMTKIGGTSENGSGRRPRIAIFALASPTSGSSAFSASLINNAGATVWLVEVKDADQTLGNWVYGGGVSTSVTARNASISAPSDDSLLVRALSILSGNYTAQISANGTATLQDTGNTGTTSTSDNTSAISTEAGVATGANTNGFAWTTAADAADAGVAIPTA